MKKRMVKFLAVMCSLALLTVSVPVSLAEEETPAAGTSEAGEAPEEEGGYREAPIVGEDVTRRSEDAKHFRRSDGSYTMVQYSTPVHYEKDGELLDIDNTLTAGVEADEAAEGEARLLAADSGATEVYGTEGNRFQVKFAKKSNGKFLMKLKQEDWSIYWSLTSPEKNKVTGQASNPAESEDPLQLTKLTSEMRYNDIFADTDLQYIVTPTGVKENIIVKKAQASYRYEFELKVKGVTLSPREDGGIDVLKEGETEASFVIPAPYMFDAAGAESTAARYELEPGGNGKKYILRVIADAEWINAADRQFPVTIDPAIVLPRDYRTIQDATVAFSTISDDQLELLKGNKDGNGSQPGFHASKLFVGNYMDKVPNKELGAIVRTDMKELQQARILSAKVCMFYYTNNTTGMQVNAYQITGSWKQGENALNYADLPAYNATPLDYSITPAGATQGKYTVFDFTKAAQEWVTTGNNQGILLRAVNWQSGLVKYIASDNGGTAEDPKFIINYRDTKGVEPYWTYTTIAAGRDTAAYINNYNGALTVASGIASAGGNVMPVSIQYIYNHNTAAWHSNYDMKIKQTADDVEGDTEEEKDFKNTYPYYLVDADGTEHYFYKESENKYLDEDGLGYTLSQVNTTDVKYEITDKSGGKMKFNWNGQLHSVNDANGNRIFVAYRDNFARINYVEDGAGRQYTFVYSGTTLTGIKDPSGRSTGFVLDNAGRVTRIKDSENVYTGITYDSQSNMVKEIMDSGDGTKVVFTYSGAPVYRIASATWYDTNGAQAGKYTFAYRHNNTLITDQDGRKYEYQFNNAGQTVGVVNLQSGQAEYYQFGAPGIPGLGEDNPNNAEAGKQNKLLGTSKVQSSISNLLSNPSFDSNISGFTVQASQTGAWDSAQGHYAPGSLKLTRSSAAGSSSDVMQTVSGLPAGEYTLSAYVHTGGATLTGSGIRLKINSYKAAGGYKTSRYSQYIQKTESSEWVRLVVNYTADEVVNLEVGVTLAGSTGTFWIDDIQLERGKNPNSFNLLENTELSSTSCWTAGNTPTVAAISGFPDATVTKALKSSGTIRSAAKYTQTVKVTGAKGDVFSFGGWGKADSVALDSPERGKVGEAAFGIRVKYGNTEEYLPFNFGYNGWQFISNKLVLKEACTSISFTFDYSYNLNTAYFTLPFLYKEEFGQSYIYDKDGNVSSAVDAANSEATFAFNNDNLMQLCNPTGSKFYYSYDDKKNLTYAQTSEGLQYHYTYDAYGNPEKVEVTVAKPVTPVADTTYYIRNCGTGEYLYVSAAVAGTTVTSHGFSGEDTKLRWRLMSAGEANVYLLRLSSGLSVLNASQSGYTDEYAEMYLLQPVTVTNQQKFKVEANGDGTFKIKTGASNYSKVLDGRPQAEDKPKVQQVTAGDKLSQKWEFIPVESSSTLKMSSSNTYTGTKGNFLQKTTDGRGNNTTYVHNSSKGLLESVTTPNGATTTYSYDAIYDRLTQVKNGSSVVQYSYYKDRLTDINVGNWDVRYQLNYDARGRRTTTRVGKEMNLRTLSTNTWNSRDLLTKMTYGNGGQVNYAYDNLDRVTKVWNADAAKGVEYSYDGEGRLALTRDYLQDQQTRYTYDMAGRVTEVNILDENWDQGTIRTKTKYTYQNGTNRLTRLEYATPELGSATSRRTETAGVAYGTGMYTDRIMSVGTSTGYYSARVLFEYDDLGRLTKRRHITAPWGGFPETTYTYVAGASGTTTNLLATVNNEGMDLLTYTYDSMGNIQTVKSGSKLETYTYDSLNQLVRVDSQRENKSITYTYDNRGNLLERKEYAYTTGTLGTATKTVSYAYGDSTWKDLMTSYSGQTITYDTIGNPLKYRDGMNFTWKNGRQLATYSKGPISASYEYDINGQRTKKTFNTVAGSVTTEYYYNNGMFLGFYRSDGFDVRPLMDPSGSMYGITVYETNQTSPRSYNFVYNAQGDVIGLYSYITGSVVATYDYDAWGNCTVKALIADDNGHAVTDLNHIANLNPFRYRGYYYDTETGLYYLQSRYYDPQTGRFLNADGMTDGGAGLLGFNLFIYGANDPINNSDPTGHWIISNFIKGLFARSDAMINNPSLYTVSNWLTLGAVDTVKGAVQPEKPLSLQHWADSFATATMVMPLVSKGLTVYDGLKTPAASNRLVTPTEAHELLAGGACFVAGTAVLTSEGLNAIENLKAGDMVWAENPETGEKALKEVVQTFARESDELVHIVVAGKQITTTPEHPFYVPRKGWTGAAQLRAGDILVLSNGKYVTVEKVQHELLEGPVTVYNFEVADFHTYYVGELSVLVHNACKAPTNQITYPGRKSAFNAAKRELGIPRSEQPTSILPNFGRNGALNPGRVYEFRNSPDMLIRDDIFGHTFSDGGIVSRHFNVSNSDIHIFY